MLRKNCNARSVLIAMLLSCTAFSTAHSQSWVLLGTWGSPDSYGVGGYTTTTSVSTDRFGYTYAADENSVVKLIGVTYVVTRWNPHGASSSSSDIQSLAVDQAGNVYIAEHNSGTIQKFTGNGAFLALWPVPGSGAGQADWMTGLAVDAAGTVYLADPLRRRVMRFASDGTPLADLPGVFINPTGVAIDVVGSIYVADYSRVLKFNSGGAYLMQWGSSGSGPGQFGYARGITTDPSAGYVYVTDTTFPRVQQFTTEGTFVSQWGLPGSGTAAMSCPSNAAVDVEGNVFVADPCSFRLMKFGWGTAPVPVARQTWGMLKNRNR